MPQNPGLRAVGPNEVPEAQKRNHRELLLAMEKRIKTAVFDPKCPPRDLASLTRRLQDIAEKLDAMDLREKQDSAANADGDIDDSFDASAI